MQTPPHSTDPQNMFNMFNRSIYFKALFWKPLHIWRYYRQTVFNQLTVMVSYVDIIGLCHSVPILLKKIVMRPKCHVRGLRFQFKRMLITGLCLKTLTDPPSFNHFLSFFKYTKTIILNCDLCPPPPAHNFSTPKRATPLMINPFSLGGYNRWK